MSKHHEGVCKDRYETKWQRFTTGTLVCLGALQSDPATTASSVDSTLLHS